MRAQDLLCAVSSDFARSEPDMRGEFGLCALRTRYARWNLFMRARN